MRHGRLKIVEGKFLILDTREGKKIKIVEEKFLIIDTREEKKI